MKVIIATKNAGKIEGAKRAFEKFFGSVEVDGIPLPSDVSEQPVNDEILLGAKNRVKNLKEYCRTNGICADLYISIESGINNFFGRWMITNIALIEDGDGFESFGTSPSFPVPEKYVDEIISTDLSRVMNKIFGEDNERKNNGGGIQLLTNGKITRIDLTEIAFCMALTKYINKEWN